MTPTDHAELARLAEAATGREWWSDDNTICRQKISRGDEWFIYSLTPARVLALLAEIAALRVDLSRKHDACQIAQDQAMENGFRATQAERQLDEAVGWLKWARPLAVIAMEDYRLLRVKSGHNDIRGTFASGTTYVGISQDEVDKIDGSATFLASMEPKT